MLLAWPMEKHKTKKRLVTKNSFILEEIIFHCSIIPDPKFPIPLSLLKLEAESLKVTSKVAK